MDEFSVRIAATANRKFNVFKLHKDDNVNWNEAKMKRENDYQPWQIKLGNGKAVRRFKATKEGGVGDNASYFIFYKPKNKSDTYEVCPIDEWYNVSATQRYKTLTSEEAEQEFERRHKTLNFFSVMHQKKNEDDESTSRETKAFKVSELDDWDNSGDEMGDSGDDGEVKKDVKKSHKKKDKNNPDEAQEEGKEDSDEGDFEQREVDYMSDSSSDLSESDEVKDETDVKGIAEEKALRNLLSSGEEDEGGEEKDEKVRDKKATIPGIKSDPDANGSDDSSDSDDDDVDEDKMDTILMEKSLPASIVKQEVKQEVEPPNPAKRKAPEPSVGVNSIASVSAPKRTCTLESQSGPINSQEKVIEDLIRKYLSRKPMTLKNLLKDIKSKLRRMGSPTSEVDDELVQTIARIIKRLNLDKQKINDVTYFSLKPA